MTNLIIGTEIVEIKAAKKKVTSNLKMLNKRIKCLDQSSTMYSHMHAFYSRKIEEQTTILKWLHPFDEQSIASV